ncbi:MAG TPA: type III pantothenate kinase, partial [Desulfobacterales bacterium]|nr:type III pantothenate kinase [Desulfobacterales bacterium]
MLFCMDIGNTNTVIGVVDGDKILHHWRIRTEPEVTSDELAIVVSNLFAIDGVQRERITEMIISCVVPPLLNSAEEFAEHFFGLVPLVVGEDTKTGMPILVDNPREVGADRVVNAVAAYEKYKTGLVVVDFGTATTFDYVSHEGTYMGGAIAPGVVISCEALFQKASKLPRVEI